MITPSPPGPCPWCQGQEFVVVESVFLEITDYGRRFDAVTCKNCGHTSFFTKTPIDELSGRPVSAARGEPYR
jgi:predicted nucleic-acid-binding Zn-ribbon protein